MVDSGWRLVMTVTSVTTCEDEVSRRNFHPMIRVRIEAVGIRSELILSVFSL
jgi:hypothetical protein